MAATENQKKVFKQVVAKVKKGEKISITKEMRESGVYSKATSKHPEKITKSKGWQELLNEHLSDGLLSMRHHELLNATTLDHQTYPMGTRTNAEKEEWYKKREKDAKKKKVPYMQVEILSDEDIRELLASVNCTVRRIVHGEMARYVYFWSADNRARKDALDMGYKLKGKYAPEKHLDVVVNIDLKKKKKIDEILGLTD